MPGIKPWLSSSYHELSWLKRKLYVLSIESCYFSFLFYLTVLYQLHRSYIIHVYNGNLGRAWKEADMACFKVCLNVYLKGLKKTMKYLNQDRLSLDSHSNQQCIEYRVWHHNVLFLSYYLVTVKGFFCFLEGILSEQNFGINSINKKVDKYRMKWLEYEQLEDLLPYKILPYTVFSRIPCTLLLKTHLHQEEPWGGGGGY
jgi:hypothetical protein